MSVSGNSSVKMDLSGIGEYRWGLVDGPVFSMVHSMETLPSSTGTSQQTPRNGPRRNEHWMFVALLLAVLLVLAGFAKWKTNPPAPNRLPSAAWTPTPQSTGETVSLEIDFGNGAKKSWAALPWQPEMTVADAMAKARDFRPGLEYGQIGTGESGFLSSLAGLANEGANGRNWIYEVDGRHATVSFCVETLEDGSRVLWRFTDEQYNEELP